MVSSIFNLSSKWLNLGLFTERMGAFYYCLVGLGETSLAQKVGRSWWLKEKYISLLRTQQYHF
jgi:hypothetical protein